MDFQDVALGIVMFVLLITALFSTYEIGTTMVAALVVGAWLDLRRQRARRRR